MINLKSDKNQKTNETRLVQILFYSFPLWFIIGNLAVSLNTLLFIIVSLVVIQRKQLTFRFNNSYWLLIAFFLYFFLSTAIQYLSPGYLNERMQVLNPSLENNPILKSFLLIRFIILIFVIDTLFINKILNLKKLFLSSLLCTSFVSFDIIMQYITGFDLFGLKKPYHDPIHNSGPFGDELIAGSYLLKFSFFSFFYIFETYKNKNFSKPLFIFIIIFHLVAILLAGNRMPLLLFLFGCVLIIFFIRNLRIVMSLSLMIFISIFFLLIKNDKNYYQAYGGFLGDINIIGLIKSNKDITNKQTGEEKAVNENIQEVPRSVIFLRHSGHNRIYHTAIKMWKEQPLTGFGFKSFRVKCWDMLAKDNAEREITPRPQNIACANHAHNYYLEFLSEAGIIGTSLIIIFFLILLKDSFNYLRKYNQQKNPEMILLIPVIILFFLEIWPLKSTGSFFTTWGATFFWLNTAMLISATTKKSL